jgi:hypothetical protein
METMMLETNYGLPRTLHVLVSFDNIKLKIPYHVLGYPAPGEEGFKWGLLQKAGLSHPGLSHDLPMFQWYDDFRQWFYGEGGDTDAPSYWTECKLSTPELYPNTVCRLRTTEKNKAVVEPLWVTFLELVTRLEKIKDGDIVSV